MLTRPCCRGHHLTDREVELLALVAGGATNPQVARVLHLSESTVRQVMTSLFRRMGVRSRGALVARAIHLGLVDASPWPPRATDVRCVALFPAPRGVLGQSAGSYSAA